MGLFDGLGKFGAGGGGLLGGAHDALYGTTPGMTAQSNDVQDDRLGTLHRAPTVTPTGEMTGGLLDKMKEPDARGLTFGDKLFAAGSVLQGDSGGAASYLANQRQTADVLSERQRMQKQQTDNLAALKGAIDPVTGQLNYYKYVDAMTPGGDPTVGLRVREGLQPDITPMSGPRGAISLFDRAKGAFVPGGIEGEARQPERFIQDEDGNWSPNPVYMQALEGEAAAKRRGAPLAGRSGGRGPKRASYGSEEVKWGG